MKTKFFSVVMFSAMIAMTSCSQDEDILTVNNQDAQTEQTLTRSAANYEELAADVANVKYQVTSDRKAYLRLPLHRLQLREHRRAGQARHPLGTRLLGHDPRRQRNQS